MRGIQKSFLFSFLRESLFHIAIYENESYRKHEPRNRINQEKHCKRLVEREYKPNPQKSETEG